MCVTPFARIHLLLLTVECGEETIERLDGIRAEDECGDELV